MKQYWNILSHSLQIQYLGVCIWQQGTFRLVAVQLKCQILIGYCECLLFWGAMFAIYSHLNIAFEIYD